jgi:hypothetical protein
VANEDSVLKEVDQELAEERQWSMFRKYGPAGIGAAAALVIGVGAFQFYNAAQTRAANQQATAFNEAVELLADNPAQGREALNAIAEEGGSGYAVLAAFRRAASLVADGERAAAIAAFQEVYEDNAAPKTMRDLARLRAGYLAIDDGREAALSHLGDLPQSSGPYRPYADEIVGVAALLAEDYETALGVFRQLSGNPETPQALSARAEEFSALAVSGKAGVNITGEIRLDDIVGAIGEAAPQNTAPAGEPLEDDAAEDAEEETDAAQDTVEPQPGDDSSETETE